MSKIEERCIAYIYNEMDPSERLEFERELQKDENLLIEFETLKRTAYCLDGLKPIEPPKSVVSNIKSKAHSIDGETREARSYKFLFASVAITLFAVFVYGALLIQDQQSAEGSHNDAVENSASVSSLNTAGKISAFSADRAKVNEDISPWVDHDEIIHFHDRFNKGSVASVDSMFNHSLRKLTRVEPSGTLQQVQQQIHLTGGNR